MGDQIAIDQMCTYNKQDTILLEEVYLKLRPWTKAHPNVAMYIDSTEPMCAHCGSKNVKKIDKPYYTQTNKYDVYRCQCGALSRGRRSITDIDKRDSLLLSTGK
jgi:DNA-directed RNA polymerase subunit RPC12/RpoP